MLKEFDLQKCDLIRAPRWFCVCVGTRTGSPNLRFMSLHQVVAILFDMIDGLEQRVAF